MTYPTPFRHCEAPLGAVAVQRRGTICMDALGCHVAKWLLAMTQGRGLSFTRTRINARSKGMGELGGNSKTRLQRRETMTTMVGMGWYRREDWERLLQMFPDRHTLQDTYDEWLADACGAERAIKGTGHVVKRVMVDPDELAAWCAIRGLRPVASARAEYACDKGREAAAPKAPGSE